MKNIFVSIGILLSTVLSYGQANEKFNYFGITASPRLYFFNHTNKINDEIIITSDNILSYDFALTKKFKIHDGLFLISGFNTSLIPAYHLDFKIKSGQMINQIAGFDRTYKSYAINSIGLPIIFEGIIDKRLKNLFFNMGFSLNFLPPGSIESTQYRTDTNDQRYDFININSTTNKNIFINTIFGISNYWHFKHFSYRLGIEYGLSFQNIMTGSYEIKNGLIDNQLITNTFNLSGSYFAISNTVEFKRSSKNNSRTKKNKINYNNLDNFAKKDYYKFGIGLMNANLLPFNFSCISCEVKPSGFILPTFEIGLIYRQKINEIININSGVFIGQAHYLTYNLSLTPDQLLFNSIDQINDFSSSSGGFEKFYIPISIEYQLLKKERYSTSFDVGVFGKIISTEDFLQVISFPDNNDVIYDVLNVEGSINSSFHMGVLFGPSIFLDRKYFGYKIGIGYNHSFTPISRGNFEFFNTNLVNPRGTFINRGHFLSLNFTMFLRNYKQKQQD